MADLKSFINTSSDRIKSAMGVPVDRIKTIQGSLLNLNDPDIKTFITGLTTPLSESEITKLNNLSTGLKEDLSITNLSDAFDFIWNFSAETEETAFRNLAKRAHDPTNHSLVHAQHVGIDGDGSSHYLETNYSPSAEGVRFTKNSACLFIYVTRQDATVESALTHYFIAGLDSNPDYIRFSPSGSDYIHWYVNSGVGTNINLNTSIPDLGLFALDRTDANTLNLYFNGKLHSSLSIASTDIPTGELMMFAYNVVGTGISKYFDGRLTLAMAGRSFSAAEHLKIARRIELLQIANSDPHMIEITAPTLILTFDDGMAEMATYVKTLLDSKNVKSTLYIVSDFIDTAGYLTSANLQTLYAAGYDLQCHTKTHADLRPLTAAQISTELGGVPTLFSSLGIAAPKHTAYPFGYNDSLATGVVAANRKTGRATGGSAAYHNAIVGNRYKLATGYGLDGFTTETHFNLLKSYIDTLVSNTGLGIIYGHGVYVTNTNETSYADPCKLSVLSDAIDYAIAHNVAIKTMSQVFG